MITYATTKITISREQSLGERWETQMVPVDSGIRAHIQPTVGLGSLTSNASGTTSAASHLLLADECDLHAGDVVTDGLGRSYQVESAFLQQGPLSHIEARLNQRSID